MKKIYLTMSVILAASLGFAQKGNPLMKEASAVHVKQTITEKPAEFVNWSDRGSCIYTNDFSTPGDWTIANDQSNTDDWVIGTAVPSGSFAIGAITSTSAANGYALYDSDLMCSGSQNGWVQIATPLNLSAENAVSIRFESYYRKFQGTCWVDVSTDGTNWTSFEVHSTLAANDFVATNPTITEVNVSSVLANAATAYFRFRYNGGCDYAWMVDDVCLTAPADDEVSLIGSSFRDVVGGIPYTLVPNEQGPSIDNMFFGDITNGGVNTQAGTQLEVTVTDGASSTVGVFTGTATSLGSGLIYNDSTTTNWNVGGTIDTYTAISKADYTNFAMDADPTNNYDTVEVSVTDHVYGRDIHNFGFNGGGLWNGAGNSYIMVNEYDCFVNQDLEAIQIALQGNTAVGVLINPVVYQVDQTTGDFNLVYDGSSYGAEYTVTAADLTAGAPATWIDLPIHAGAGGFISLAAGEIYLVGIQHYGGADDVVLLNGGISAPEQTVFIFDGSQSDWFYMTSTPAIRANFDPAFNAIGEEEASNLTLGQNVPNPFNGVSTISYSLESATAVSFEVTDVTGKLIENVNLGTLAAGNHTIELNSADYSKGVYFYSMTAGNEKLTKRMVVTK